MSGGENWYIRDKYVGSSMEVHYAYIDDFGQSGDSVMKRTRETGGQHWLPKTTTRKE